MKDRSRRGSKIAQLLGGSHNAANTGARRLGRAVTGDYAREDTRDPKRRPPRRG